MQTTTPEPCGIHLVGSLPHDRFSSAADVFSALPKKLLGHLKRIPDGELGDRNQYIMWQEAVFPNHILKRTVAQNGDRLTNSHTAHNLPALGPIMYDDAAISSYRAFAEAKDAGIISTHVRFQISLPSPIEPPATFVHESYQDEATRLYEQQLTLALERIQSAIPPKELAIQWDIAVTIALVESKRGRLDNPLFTCCFDNPLERNIQALRRIAAVVRPEVEMGFHLCYGDIAHQHFVEPEDTSLMVELSMELVREVHSVHSIAWIHMPVPKDRTDEGYFAALTRLELPGTTELFLGVLHPDGLENNVRRIELARNASAKQFGVATECGLGRTKGKEGDNLLDLAVRVSQPW
jgi:methionine synthase II (cobalamin-independent)